MKHSTRRSFLKVGGLAAFSQIAGCTSASEKTPKQNPHSQQGGPVVLSTWKQLKAHEAAIPLLEEGRSALDVVEAGVRVPEADPDDMSVGYGGLPDRDGIVTLDACIMDDKGNAGSVTFLQNIMHPISVARAVMEKTPHVMLSGKGALDFALSQGFKQENLLTEKSKKAWQEWLKTAEYKPKANIERHDTIGMVALDKNGNLSGACTTSGMAYKLHGRVGDSPIIGAGLFVDNEIGAACATGVGELVMKTMGAFLIVELMRQGYTPQEACEEAAQRIIRKQQYRDFQVGYLALNKKGEHGAYSLQKGFNYTIYQKSQNQVIEADFYGK
ncbi:MAG: isoaspartyl peptidase/L-asparaginase family protein [Runella sp.]